MVNTLHLPAKQTVNNFASLPADFFLNAVCFVFCCCFFFTSFFFCFVFIYSSKIIATILKILNPSFSLFKMSIR